LVSVVSGNALVDLAGLSVSLAASATYEIKGAVMYEAGTSGGIAFGISLPATKALGGSFIHAFVQSVGTSQNNTGAGVPHGVWSFSAFAGQTVFISVSVNTTNALRFMRFDGMINTSLGGTAQLMAKGSVAGSSLSVRSGFFRAFRLC
jgi:hypothetical protein